jgi:spore coat polysaccharide biosynthesis predicted glycosyltransferase SpsG
MHIKSLKTYLIFADGGNHKGYGHLSRMKTLVRNLDIQDEVLCLHENNGQKSFWEEHDCIDSHSLRNVSSKLKDNHHILIIDSKDDRSDILVHLQRYIYKIIVIDNETRLLEKADFKITPIFYSPNKKVNNLQSNALKIGSGVGYAIIDEQFLSPHTMVPKANLTLSFGGYDPNNITLKVLQRIQSQDELLKDLIVILGPGYKHDIHEIYKFVHPNQVLVNPADIYKIFQRSYVVLTAMGVTVQELFCMGIPSGIIYNYDFDKSDIEKIKYYSSILRPQENLVDSFGHFASIDSVSLHETLSSHKSSNKVFSPLKKAGYMWGSFLDDIS